NFFGRSFDQLYVNNNGNVTFDEPLGTYTPFGLTDTGSQIIAPFFGDVWTFGTALVRYGTGTLDGHRAFGVEWPGVGYYSATNRLNVFELVLIDRSEVSPGDFDIEFNYNQVQWETGSASGGRDGLGGSAARVGYSNGSGEPG